eukprot:gb/GECH01006675.1/.p1 GENE.gb/GECH01006675.1/~~gb/GECH01006675.1/.p1  ORF type:complete len:265 (+),score=24.49 gb/GECH01006675.1/:1-795(+)
MELPLIISENDFLFDYLFCKNFQTSWGKTVVHSTFVSQQGLEFSTESAIPKSYSFDIILTLPNEIQLNSTIFASLYKKKGTSSYEANDSWTSPRAQVTINGDGTCATIYRTKFTQCSSNDKNCLFFIVLQYNDKPICMTSFFRVISRRKKMHQGDLRTVRARNGNWKILHMRVTETKMLEKEPYQRPREINTPFKTKTPNRSESNNYVRTPPVQEKDSKTTRLPPFSELLKYADSVNFNKCLLLETEYIKKRLLIKILTELNVT